MKNFTKKIILVSLFSLLIYPFFSFAATTLTVTSLESNKATIKATGLFSGGDYSLAVHSSSASTPAYNKTLQLTADSNGIVQGNFTGLAANGSYSGIRQNAR